MRIAQKIQLITLLLLWHKNGEFSPHETWVLYQALFKLLRQIRDDLKEVGQAEDVSDIPF